MTRRLDGERARVHQRRDGDGDGDRRQTPGGLRASRSVRHRGEIVDGDRARKTR